MRPGPHTEPAPPGANWYRQPVAWLAALILLATLIAIVATIVVAQRFRDEPLPVTGARVLKTPVARDADPAMPVVQDVAE